MINIFTGSEGMWADIGLLFLRLGLFVVFFVHALPKIRKTEELSSAMGIKKAMVLTLGVAEMVASVLMLFGFSIQIASFIIALVMLGSISMKIFKWHVGFIEANKVGWEFDFVLFLIAVALFLMGPGVVSIQDYIIF